MFACLYEYSLSKERTHVYVSQTATGRAMSHPRTNLDVCLSANRHCDELTLSDEHCQGIDMASLACQDEQQSKQKEQLSV